MPEKTFKFTKQDIEDIPYPQSGRVIYRDKENKYLRLYVTANNKVFYYMRKIKGRNAQKKIGVFGEKTVHEARRKAEEYSGEAANGVDPIKKEKKAQITNLGELWQRYLQEHAKPHKRTWQEDERIFHYYLSRWKNKSLDDIDPSDVSALHRRMRDEHGPYQANRILALLRKIFNHGIEQHRLDLRNPCQGVKAFKEQSRSRFLDADELARFFGALQDEKTNPTMRDFIELALWTGARRGNIQAMRWKDIDFNSGVWTIPGEQFKNGEQQRVPLSEPAIDILTRRKVNAKGKSPYVFPSKRKNAKTPHLTEPKKAWQDLLKRAELHDVRLHDLRRTLGSWQAATGASLQVIGKTLGHRNQATTEIYSRLNLDPIQESVNTATAAMQKAIQSKTKKNEQQENK